MWSTPAFEAVARVVHARTGLAFSAGMRSAVETKIRRAMAARSVADLSRYLTLLSSDGGAFEALLAELTIGETYFFREPEQLDYIRSNVLPELVGPDPGRPLRAWSAGCASGEEAYTLAILLREEGVAGGGKVIGTDISRARIEQARKGVYSSWSMRGTPDQFVQRYFRRQGSRYLLAPEILSAVTFGTLNLGGKSYPSAASGIWGMDLILCRNVLIYLAPEAVAEIAPRLLASLGEEGWLFLGASDPPLTGLVPCEVVVTGAGVAYRRPRRAAIAPPTGRPAPAPRVAPPAERRQPEPSAVPATGAHAEDPAEKVEDVSLIEASFAARDYPRAAALALQALKQSPEDVRLWLLAVRALAKQGNFDEAGRTCSAALEVHRSSAELICLHATLLAAAGHDAQSAAAARRALFLDRSMVMAHLVLGLALLRLDDPPKARRALQNAERLLVALPPDTIVPGSDGEPAARLLELIRLRLKAVPV